MRGRARRNAGEPRSNILVLGTVLRSRPGATLTIGAIWGHHCPYWRVLSWDHFAPDLCRSGRRESTGGSASGPGSVHVAVVSLLPGKETVGHSAPRRLRVDPPDRFHEYARSRRFR